MFIDDITSWQVFWTNRRTNKEIITQEKNENK